MDEIYNNNMGKKKHRSQSEWAFSIMLFMVWTRLTVINYIVAYVKRMPIINVFADYLYPFCILALIVFALPYLRIRIRPTEIILYMVIIAALPITNMMFEANSVYISLYMSDIVWTFAPMLFIGVCYDHKKEEKVLFWASICGVVVGILYQNMKAQSGSTVEYDSMGLAYRILPSVMYLIYWSFTHNRIGNWLLTGVSSIYLLVFGTRGPILNIIIFLAIGFLHVSSEKNMRHSGFWLIAVIVGAFILLRTNILDTVAEELRALFENWGMSTRIFDFYLEGEIDNTSGRSELTADFVEKIWQSPMFGYGLMGDRVLFKTYAHNFFIEVWIEFGVVFGTMLIAFIVALAVKALKKQWQNRKVTLFLLMILCLNFVKLMVSGSYITEPHFFFMIGVLLATSREQPMLSGQEMESV